MVNREKKMIFLQEEREILEWLSGFSIIFDTFEKMIVDDKINDLETLNDVNVNILLQAMKKEGLERKCFLYQYAFVSK